MMLVPQENKIIVGGIVAKDVKEEPRTPAIARHALFEIDTIDPKVHEFILSVYKNCGISVLVHPCGAGYHYFGEVVAIELWREWYKALKPLNPTWPPQTLRITRKRQDERWGTTEFFKYSDNEPIWIKSLVKFLDNNIFVKEESIDTKELSKYWKIIYYYVSDRR